MSPWSQFVYGALLRLFTCPYYWALHVYTLHPIQDIADAWNRHGDVVACVHAFRETKRSELHFVRTGATTSAAAVIGYLQLSLPLVTGPFRYLWISTAVIYVGLLFALVAVLLSSHYLALLETYSDIRPEDEAASPRVKQFLGLVLLRPHVNAETGRPQVSSSFNLITIWQAPIMLMSYSWMLFASASSIRLGTAYFSPAGVDQEAKNIATAFFAGCAIVWFVLFYCAGALYKRNLQGQAPPTRDLKSSISVESGASSQTYTPVMESDPALHFDW